LSALATRVATALVLVPATLAALFLLPPAGWAAVTLAVIVIASLEWSRLCALHGIARAVLVGLVLVVGVLLLVRYRDMLDHGWPPAVLLAACGIATLFWALVAPVWLRERWRMTSPAVSAIVGAVVLLGAWVALVHLQAQSGWRVLAAMAVVWIADTAAYFTGRALGRHKLAPAISPGKTWEGVAGGLVAVAAYAIVLLVAMREHVAGGAGWIAGWFVVALAVAGLSVVGDLFESLLKRHAGMKDSGNILPGHGGILDRIDALIAAMPPLALVSQFGLR